jgi:hypothetical protein
VGHLQGQLEEQWYHILAVGLFQRSIWAMVWMGGLLEQLEEP